MDTQFNSRCKWRDHPVPAARRQNMSEKRGRHKKRKKRGSREEKEDVEKWKKGEAENIRGEGATESKKIIRKGRKNKTRLVGSKEREDGNN